MKLITWNVNGLRACLVKGLLEYLGESGADIIALQETKAAEPIPQLSLDGYTADWNGGGRQGYSGTVCLFRQAPISAAHGFGDTRLYGEGRLIVLEYPSFYFINAYVPNSQGGLERWYYRLDWDSAFAEYIEGLLERKPVIACGDFNVARDYIDVYPENLHNIKSPHGFLSEERDGFDALLELGMSDVFRSLYPARERAYSWWSNRLNKRSEKRGWRRKA